MAVGSVLTFATEGILTKLIDLAAEEFRMAWGFKAELRKLSQSLSILQDFLGDVAEKGKDGGKAEGDWVKKLKDIADEADDVLEDINYEFLRRRVELQNRMGKKVLNFISASNFRQKMAHRIRKISASLADLKNEAAFIGLVAKKKDPTFQRIREDRETNAFIGKDEIIIGRNAVVSDIVTTLTNSNTNEKNLLVMAIVGMPGLGKTTLAKSVYNEGAINEYFNKKLWVCVSNTFSVNSILTAMLELLSRKVATTSQQALLTNLGEELSGKRYFLVLDDVWNEDLEKWERLMSCLSKLNSAPGSKIIVTTRSVKVASITETLPRPKLELLSTDECWSILKYAACSDGSSDVPLHLESIGREIAKKCDGLPLMAKVLEGILRSKKTTTEWSKVKDSRIWELPKGEDKIMSVLKLSFDNLESPALKQCFAYCSTFMKDAEMERDVLIQLWMAQGLLHPCSEQSNLEMEDIGNEYFDILFQSSLFQDAIVDDEGIVIQCKMHDLLHDLAERVSESGCMMRDFPKIQHVATPSIIERIPEGSSGKLRSLFLNAEALPRNMLPVFKALRVLKLFAVYIEELPSSIGKLKHLRYLDISFTVIKSIPNSIGRLYNLQTLRATNSRLEEFPKDVQNLINLRHVYCDRGTKFPVVGVLGKLTSLRKLPYEDYVVMGREIEELAALNQLKGKLIICNLEHVRNRDEARIAKLKNKKNLRGLIFVWSKDRSITNNNNEEDVLEGLQPHSELERLEIQYFMGTKFPSWMIKLDNLKQIKLKGRNRCEEVPTLGHLPHLTFVWIEGIDNLKCVGAEIYGTDLVYDEATAGIRRVVVFPALKELHIHDCKELIEWMEAPEQVMVFPCLGKLDIRNCPNLRKAPSHFPSLKKLNIQGHKELTCLSKEMLLKIERMKIRDWEKLTCIAPDVFGCCASLRKLLIYQCPSLQSIQDLHSFKSLRELSIKSCERLESLVSNGPVSIVELSIIKCGGLESIPDLNLFTSLRKLNIQNCERLESLVSSGPVSVVELSIIKCVGLESIQDLNLFTSLCKLNIQNCKRLESLVSSGPVFVVDLRIWSCGGLESILDLNLYTSLCELSIKSCERLESLVSSGPISIVRLHIWSCGDLQSIPDLNLFTSLCELSIESCERLESLVSSGPVSVVDLGIWSCDGLQSIPNLNLFTSLCQLSIQHCERLESLVSSGVQLPSSLVELKIRNAPNLESLRSLDNLTSLCQLVIYNCGKLKYLPTRLHCCASLKALELGWFCEELDSFPDFHLGIGSSQLQRLELTGWPKLKYLPQQIQHFTSLTSLQIRRFNGVEALEDWLGNLTSLKTLDIRYCQKLMNLPSVTAMQRLTKLQTLRIWECPLLEERCTKDSGTEWPKISHIPKIYIW
ncbi:putative disease resistance protein RGA3 [Prunus avium]|uniref:Disease resistance protein RGA3 n=1 Tax=Prunus avium TaxID=42229 RepID=A0A6P5R9C0_PRUAV|nr:putative disease resistance protein RGA3 [Prunus avium]XP_021801496.1 putative disease resistance protein RGA3 [Prunus avium]